jgi:hypothetical protein
LLFSSPQKLIPEEGNFRDRPKLEGCSFFKSIAVLSLHVFFLSLSTPVLAQTKSNYEVLAALTDSLLAEISGAIPPFVNQVVIREWRFDRDSVQVSRRDGSNWFLESRIVDILKTRDLAVYVDSGFQQVEHAADSTAVVEFKLMEIGIDYLRQNRGAEVIGRKAYVHFWGRVRLRATGRILYNGALQASKSDWIAAENRQVFENPDIEFTVGKIQTVKRDGGVLQPLAVVVVTGVVVYLFYSLRSR